MQEEVSKHTKKIYNAAKNPKHSFGEKAKEIGIEIAIIVFAVTLSISLHGWSEHRHQQEEVKTFLVNLKADLTKDIDNLNSEKESYLKINKEYDFLSNITTFQLDSVAKTGKQMAFPIHTTGRKTNDGNYESFKSSGKLSYVENEKLKQLFVKYYQQSVPNMNDIDKLYTDFIVKMIDVTIDNAGQSDKKLYINPKFRKTLSYIIMLGSNNARVYNDYGIKEAKEIIKEIDKELKK